MAKLGCLLGSGRGLHSVLGCLLVLVAGVLGCSAVVGMMSAPVGWQQAREAKRLPRPQPDELAALQPGERVLVAARLAPETPSEAHGLALFYSMSRPRSEAAEDSPARDAKTWTVERPPPRRFAARLANGQPVRVQLGQRYSFLEAERVDRAEDGSALERRFVGYLPGQALTLRATWEGDGLLTARELFPGTPDDYLAFLARRPGAGLVASLVFAALAVALLGAAALLRFRR